MDLNIKNHQNSCLLFFRFYLVNAIDTRHWYFLGDFLIWDLGHLSLDIFHLGSAILSLNVPLYAWSVIIDDFVNYMCRFD
ncbi:hypothetical protein GIB67_015739, partial [Kingdonia uniflora]